MWVVSIKNYLVLLSFLVYLLLIGRFQVASGFLATTRRSRFLVETRQSCCRWNAARRSAATLSIDEKNKMPLLEQLANRLQGDFDNYNQVLRDVRNNKFPGPTGGHEHMHCTFVPIHKHNNIFQNEKHEKVRIVIAAYYLNGQPNQMFRLRLYTMKQEEETEQEQIRMKLYLPSDSIRDAIKAMINQPLQWENIIQSELAVPQDGQHREHFFELKGCDVLWTAKPNPNRHTYLVPSSNEETPPEEEAFHAMLENKIGSVILPSMNYPGTSMLIKDELSFWKNELWINDRGYNVDTLDQIYGNHHGVPYKVYRVTNIVQQKSSASYDRVPLNITNSTDCCLSWTLGESWRTRELYQQKIDAILLQQQLMG